MKGIHLPHGQMPLRYSKTEHFTNFYHNSKLNFLVNFNIILITSKRLAKIVEDFVLINFYKHFKFWKKTAMTFSEKYKHQTSNNQNYTAKTKTFL